MSYVPHVRDQIVWAGFKPGTLEMEVQPGDFLVFMQATAATSARGIDYAGVTNNGFPYRRSLSGTNSNIVAATHWVTEAGTVMLGPPNDTYHNGTITSAQASNTDYGICQSITAFDNIVGYQWYAGYRWPFMADSPAASTYGRPVMATASAPGTVDTNAAAATYVLTFGHEYHTNSTDTSSPTFAPSSGLLYDVAYPTFVFHTTTHARYIDVSDVSGGIPFDYSVTNNGSSVFPVVAIPVTTSDYDPSPPQPVSHPLTMGDGTPVTLEGWWDGTQLLPAEFVGLPSA